MSNAEFTCSPWLPSTMMVQLTMSQNVAEAEVRPGETVARQSPWMRPGMPEALVGLITFVVFAESLAFRFVWDDPLLLLTNPTIQSWRYLPQYFTSHLWQNVFSATNYYRPLFLVWLRLNHATFGFNAVAWHLTTVLAHVAAAVLVCRLARRLTGNAWTGVICGVVFGVHPVHTESAAWICDSLESISTAFAIGSFLCWLKFRDDPKTNGWLAGSLPLYFCGMLVKEPVIMVPAIIAAYEYLVPATAQVGSRFVRLGKALRASLAFLPCAVVYIAARTAALHGFTPVALHVTFKEMALTWPAAVWFYVKLLVAPAGLSAYYDLPLVTSIGASAFWRPLLAIALCGAAVFVTVRLLRPQAGVARFAIAWMVLTLLPALNLRAFSKSELVHDRYVYLASVGFALLVGVVLSCIRVGKDGGVWVRAVLAIVLVVGLAGSTLAQEMNWASDVLLFSNAVKHAPENLQAIGNLGAALGKKGEYQRALPLLKYVADRSPDDSHAMGNLGYAYYYLGNYDTAAQCLKRTVELEGLDAPAHAHLGMAYLNLGEFELAEAEFRRTLELDPRRSNMHMGLSYIMEHRNDVAGALSEMKMEAEITPDAPEVRSRLQALRSRLQR